MNPEDAPPNESEPDLPAIDFHSPGRFAVHNPQPEIPGPERREPAPFELGREASLQRFASAEEAQAHALALLQQSRHSLCLYTPDLEPWLYNHSSVQEACTRLLLASPRNRLRILLRDVGSPVSLGHRLLNLGRRVTSNLHIRRLNPDLPCEESAYLLADAHGLLLRPQADAWAGYACYNDPARVRQQQAQFDQAWNTSVLDPDLRSFLL
jgi:hypothetical protein